MAKFTERHNVSDDIVLFKQENSSKWYARFKVENTWYTRATKETDLPAATVKAVKLHTEFQIMVSNNLPVHTTRKSKRQGFNAIADMAIQRMEQQIESGAKSKRLNAYIGNIKNYLKPFFNDCMFWGN